MTRIDVRTTALAMTLATARRVVLLGLVLGLCTAAHATNDDEGIADRLEAIGFGGIGIASPVNLHAAGRLEDGIRGHAIHIAFERVFPEPPDEAGLSDDDALAWASGCGAAAIVVATSVGSTGLLTRSKRMIFTKERFRVDTVIAPGLGLAPGSAVDVVTPGGTVVDEKEMLRVVYNGGPVPTTGVRHLLELRPFADPALADVRAASVTPADDPPKPLRLSWGFERPTIDALRDGIARVVATTPCTARPHVGGVPARGTAASGG